MEQWKKIEDMEEYKKKIDIFESIYHLNKKELQEKYVELALKINKAIEYINNYEYDAISEEVGTYTSDLLEILEGEYNDKGN